MGETMGRIHPGIGFKQELTADLLYRRDTLSQSSDFPHSMINRIFESNAASLKS